MKANTFCDEWLSERTVPVPESGCIIWLGPLQKGGYGKTTRQNKTVVAHKAVWEARNGPVPDGLILCHTCDVACCVNPDHLYVGTHKDNARDRDTRGRGRPPSGTDNGMSRLTEDQVVEIRDSDEVGLRFCERYGISPATVSRIRNSVSWRHLGA